MKWPIFIFGILVAITPFIIDVPETWIPYALGVGIAFIIGGLLMKKGESL